jgi:hypothetical protein
LGFLLKARKNFQITYQFGSLKDFFPVIPVKTGIQNHKEKILDSPRIKCGAGSAFAGMTTLNMTFDDAPLQTAKLIPNHKFRQESLKKQANAKGRNG